MESFNEKIAQVRTTINDDDNTDFTEFYGVKNFPVNFDLNVSVMLLNIIPDKNYTIQIGSIANRYSKFFNPKRQYDFDA